MTTRQLQPGERPPTRPPVTRPIRPDDLCRLRPANPTKETRPHD